MPLGKRTRSLLRGQYSPREALQYPTSVGKKIVQQRRQAAHVSRHSALLRHPLVKELPPISASRDTAYPQVSKNWQGKPATLPSRRRRGSLKHNRRSVHERAFEKTAFSQEQRPPPTVMKRPFGLSKKITIERYRSSPICGLSDWNNKGEFRVSPTLETQVPLLIVSDTALIFGETLLKLEDVEKLSEYGNIKMVATFC